ncbi:hypothetical protein FI667_g12978, partial [Globisporangium splendens]
MNLNIPHLMKINNTKTDKRLIRHDDKLNVLVLLISGEVKVATPRLSKQSTVTAATTATTGASHTLPSTARGSACGSSKFKSSLNQEASEPYFVVHAPAVFGQEGCLSNTSKPAPWDIDAIDTCTIVCLRMDTISIFLAPRQDIVRSLVREHQCRVEDFKRRFAQHRRQQQDAVCHQTSLAHKQASYLRLLSSTRKLFVLDTNSAAAGQQQKQQRSSSQIAFPKVLVKDEHVVASTDKSSVALRGGQSPRAPAAARRQTCKVVAENLLTTPTSSNSVAASKIDRPRQQQRAQTAPASCGERQDAFLHHALPHGNILALREQLQFVSFEEQQRAWTRQQQQQRPQRSQRRQQAERTEDEQRVEAKTQALLQGLRRLQAQDVEMILVPAHSAGKLSVKHAHAMQFHFATINPTLNT